MNPHPTFSILIFLFLCCFTMKGVAQTIPASDGEWDDRFDYNIDGTVTSIAAYGNDVYIAGSFTHVAGIPALNIARWDGRRWESLGNSLEGEIKSIIVDSNGYLYTAQRTADGTSSVKYWDGTRWNALGENINGEVRVISYHDNSIYIGGSFATIGTNQDTVNSVARWDGNSWHGLGNGVRVNLANNGYVTMMTWLGDTLVVGGNFYTSGTTSVSNIAFWDGIEWKPLSQGLVSSPSAIAAIGNTVYVSLIKSSPPFTKYLDAFDFTFNSWRVIDSTLPSNITAMYVSDNTLYVGGAFGQSRGIGALDTRNETWSWLKGISGGIIYSLTMSPHGLIAGGDFISDSARSLAYWNNDTWHAFDTTNSFGLPGAPSSLSASGNDIYICGYLSRAGLTKINGIGRWDGKGWDAVPEVDSLVTRVAADTSGTYFGIDVNGYNRYGLPINDTLDVIWHRDTSWTRLHLNAFGRFTTIVPAGDNLYVGGTFQSLGDSVQSDSTVYSIARWNHTTGSWSWLNSRLYRDTLAAINAMASYGNNLIVGGLFDSIGGIAAKNVARWDGNAWHAIGDGLDSTVLTLAFSKDGTLYAGGNFTGSGSEELRYLAQSNGATWFALDGAPNWTVQALRFTDNALYVGGRFTKAGAISSSGLFGLARLDLKTGVWSQPGGGIPVIESIGVTALTSIGNDLYVAGEFKTAGGKPSCYFAHYATGASSVAPTHSSIATAGFRGISPNPVNAKAIISFALPHTATVTLSVCSTIGEEIQTIAAGEFESGEHIVQWDTDDLPNGLYFCRLLCDGVPVTTPIIITR